MRGFQLGLRLCRARSAGDEDEKDFAEEDVA